MGQGFSLGNIIKVDPIDLSEGDFTNEAGFFLRSTAGATVRYCPLNNKTDAEAITKDFPASEKFEDPEIIRKVFAATSPVVGDLYAGYGV